MTHTAQIETIQLNNESNAGGGGSVDLFECHVWWLLWFRVSLSPGAKREPQSLSCSCFLVPRSFYFFQFKVWNQWHLLLWKWRKGEQLFELSYVTHKERAIGKNRSIQSKCCGSSLLLVLVRALMFHLLQGLGWGERKTANEIKQKFPSPWCLATIQCARETVRCLQMFSLSCINFTGSLLCTKENSKKKTTQQLPIKSAWQIGSFVSEWAHTRAFARVSSPARVVGIEPSR